MKKSLQRINPIPYIFILLSVPIFLGSSSIVEVTHNEYHHQYLVVQTDEIMGQQWDTLPQVKFWQTLMQLSSDTGVMNIKDTREIVEKIPMSIWKEYTDTEKDSLRDSLRHYCDLEDTARILFTSGKQDYYSVELSLPSITKAIEIFEDDTVDPFYAQAILLIESPGKNKRSRNGAYGQFQLMKGVARKAGLTVDRYTDERKNFEKSATAAAYLMRTLYIPAANQILGELGIEYNPNDFWYKLLVLHVYHAGAYNVKRALEFAGIVNTEGCNSVIQTLWDTKYRRFGNASQNYTQLALAAHLIMDDYLATQCSDPYFCR